MLCKHCQTPIPDDAAGALFCCAGCEAVYGLLETEGLKRFYSLAGDRVAPAAHATDARSLSWLEPLLEDSERRGGELGQLTLDVQGIQCAACVWLMNELFNRSAGGVRLVVNPGIGRMELVWKRGEFDVGAFVRRIEGYGYRLGPPLKTAANDGLTWRLGVCAAITVNVMLFSVSFYFGLSPSSGDSELYRLFLALSLVLTTTAVGIGGWPFFRSALRGLREGVLHLDLPISLGIVLVYVASLLQLQAGGGDLYLDTLSTFITLMLFGRWMQRRIVAKNKSWLLEDAGLEGLVCRRIEGSRVRVVPATAVREGDELIIAPGELVPVDATLRGQSGQVSLEWISGESRPHQISQGASVGAGSFNVGDSALELVATAKLDATVLPKLLERSNSGAAADAFWNKLAKNWSSRVLAIAAFGFVVWLPKGLDAALSVAAALLVITCPCAIGLAIPLAYEVVQARLKRLGFYARNEDLLDRLRHVKKVMFDKTGTLTLSRLELELMPSLTVAQLDAAYSLACASGHPASACVARNLLSYGAKLDPAIVAREVAGDGVISGAWKLGRRANGRPGTGLFYGGTEVAVFSFREALRPHAAQEVRSLQENGYDVWLVSGDEPGRVELLAERLGIDPKNVRAAQKPNDKAELIASIDQRDTLFLGDGVNDAPAFARAFCAGTPAVDRPVMPSRAGFFFVGEGLTSLSQALALSHDLHRVVKRLVAASLSYNVLAVTAALLGLVTPLRAAVFMPLSSVSLLLFAMFALRPPRSVAPHLQEARA